MGNRCPDRFRMHTCFSEGKNPWQWTWCVLISCQRVKPPTGQSSKKICAYKNASTNCASTHICRVYRVVISGRSSKTSLLHKTYNSFLIISAYARVQSDQKVHLLVLNVFFFLICQAYVLLLDLIDDEMTPPRQAQTQHATLCTFQRSDTSARWRRTGSHTTARRASSSSTKRSTVMRPRGVVSTVSIRLTHNVKLKRNV